MTKMFAMAMVLVGSSVVFAAGGAANLGGAGTGAVPTTPGLKSDSAEFCVAVDGSRQITRGFSTTETYYVEAPTDPRKEPEVKEKYRYEKDSAGKTTKNAVEPEMFDLMAEPFGGSPQPRMLWAGAYEILFEGKISIFDNNNQHVGTFVMKCNGGLLEYN